MFGLPGLPPQADGARCPRCGSAKVSAVATMAFNVVARVVANTSGRRSARLSRNVSNHISLLCADQHPSYSALHKDYFMRRVDQSKGQYLVGAVLTHTIEDFWSLVSAVWSKPSTRSSQDTLCCRR